MSITLTRAGTTTTLPPDLIWGDRFDWSATERAMEYSTTGALLIDIGTRQAGRPITLAGGDTWGWMSHAQADAVRALADQAGATFTLQIHGDGPYTVAFAPTDSTPAFAATQVIDFADPQAADWVVPTIRLIEL